MFPVAKCETCFSGIWGGKKETFFLKIQGKGFLALGIPATDAVNTGEVGPFFLSIYFFFLQKIKIPAYLVM